MNEEKPKKYSKHPSKVDLLKSYSRYLYDSSRKPKAPELFVSVDGKRISTLGNLLAISGISKCGKTSFVAALIAPNLHESLIGKDIDTFGFEVYPNPDKKEIIYINTELGDHDFAKLIERILTRANLNSKPDFFHALNFTGLTTQELIKKTREFIDELAKFNGIRAIVIDGIAEYVTTVNDPSQSSEVIREFLSMARSFNAVVITVIHKNTSQNDGNSRGHLGSDLYRKAEATLDLKITGDATVISCRETRNANSRIITPRIMRFDEAKGDFENGGTKQKCKPKEIPNKPKKAIDRIYSLFDHKQSYTYRDLTEQFQTIYGIKESMAKKRIRSFVKDGVLSKVSGMYSLIKTQKAA